MTDSIPLLPNDADFESFSTADEKSLMGLRRQERAGRFFTVILNMWWLAAALDKEAEE